jgi:hypothetical protein
MDVLKAIEKLAHQAREERIPEFDVADRVLQQIRPAEEETFGLLAFELFASASAVAASVVGYFSVSIWKLITSPLMQFFAPLQEIRLW